MCQGPARQESPSPMQGHPGTHSTQTRREGCRAHPQDGSIPAPARGADWAHIQTCPPVSFTLTSVTCLPRQQGTSPKPWDPRQHQATGQVAQYRPQAMSQSRGKHPRIAQTVQGPGGASGPPGNLCSCHGTHVDPSTISAYRSCHSGTLFILAQALGPDHSEALVPRGSGQCGLSWCLERL